MATEIIEIGTGEITLTGQPFYPMPVFADPITFQLSTKVGVSTPGYGPNANNSIVWSAAVRERGIIKHGLELTGRVAFVTILDNTTISLSLGIEGRFAQGYVNQSSIIELALGIDAEWYITHLQKNWVKWSKIGEASFIIDRTNEAGSRPMDWKGWAWQVRQLGKNAVIYGEGGITVMYPSSATFGFKDISQVGLLSSHSLATTKHVHYFITKNGDLWRMTGEGPERLGFKEFLGDLINPVLFYDEQDARLFISDSSKGFVFKDGLGGGHSSLTGYTDSLVASPGVLTPIPFSLMTDTIDLGHRGIKTVTFVEVGMDTTEDVFIAVDFRYKKTEDWRTSAWVRTNPEGVAKITVAAVEFRIRVKQDVYDEVRIDYINVRHQRSDRRFLRGPLFEQPDQGDA